MMYKDNSKADFVFQATPVANYNSLFDFAVNNTIGYAIYILIETVWLSFHDDFGQ